MKRGDNICGYRLLEDFRCAGGGQCRWTFAEKNGKSYFIKEFLAPTFPVEGAPGSEKIKQQKLSECQRFEKNQVSFKKAVGDKVREGGNLIFTIDFFRNGTKYYKVTEKVDVSSLDVTDIAKLPIQKRILVLITVAHSLAILHDLNIVHGDLKPANILIKETFTGDFTTKLIDFDGCYIAGEPPLPDEIVGDQIYYSPELIRYIKKDKSIKPTDLQVKSDVFALGLIYYQYLTGSLPAFPERYGYPATAVNDGVPLTLVDESLPKELTEIISVMLQANPAARPHIKAVFTNIKKLKDGPIVPPIKPYEPRTTGGLRGTLIVPKGPEEPKHKDAPSKLKGTLIKS